MTNEVRTIELTEEVFAALQAAPSQKAMLALFDAPKGCPMCDAPSSLIWDGYAWDAALCDRCAGAGDGIDFVDYEDACIGVQEL